MASSPRTYAALTPIDTSRTVREGVDAAGFPLIKVAYSLDGLHEFHRVEAAGVTTWDVVTVATGHRDVAVSTTFDGARKVVAAR